MPCSTPMRAALSTCTDPWGHSRDFSSALLSHADEGAPSSRGIVITFSLTGGGRAMQAAGIGIGETPAAARHDDLQLERRANPRDEGVELAHGRLLSGGRLTPGASTAGASLFRYSTYAASEV